MSTSILIVSAVIAANPAPADSDSQTNTNNNDARYLLSPNSLTDSIDAPQPFPGFLTGLQGFDNFYEPVGNPIYFETPANYSGARFLFLHHEFHEDSVLGGGDLNVAALQLRIALTERLGFIATKDGYSWLDADVLPEESGWNNLAAGLKYVFIADADSDFLLTAGARFEFASGQKKILQGGVEEFSPFVSAAKGWDRFHLIGNVSPRIPFDGGDGNTILQWSLHADYELFDGVAPLVELHGLHYLDDGDRTPLPIGGLDYTNLGSTDVSGNKVIWLGLGAAFKLTPNLQAGATYEFALTDPEDDIMDERFTLSIHLIW